MTAGYGTLPSAYHVHAILTTNPSFNIIPTNPTLPPPPKPHPPGGSPGSLYHSLTLSRLWYELNDSSDAAPCTTKPHPSAPFNLPQSPLPPIPPHLPPSLQLKAGGKARGAALHPHYYRPGGPLSTLLFQHVQVGQVCMRLSAWGWLMF